MTTRLERNIERIARNLNVEFEVVKEGHTADAEVHTRSNGNTR